MPRRQRLTWSPQFRSASSARAVSGSNTGISGATACSMFAYFYINSVATSQLILSMGASSGANAGMQLRALTATTVDLNISGIGSVPVIVSQSIVGRWISVACTKAAGSGAYLIYVNGTSINGSGALTANFTNSTFYIGSDQTPTAAFNGNISCAGIWNSVLSAAEILALHNNPVVIQGSPKVFYTMSEGSGTQLVDISGNGNHGTLTGTTWDGGQVPFGVHTPQNISSPNDILSPLFYLDSRYGVTNTGGKASAWLDQSPNAISFVQATDANRPTIVASGINGLQSLKFTAAADEYMTGTTNFIGGAKEHSLFCVIRGEGTGIGGFVGFLALGSSGAGGQTSTIGLDSANLFWFGGAGDGTPTVPYSLANSTSYVLGKGTDSRYVDVFYNGSQIYAGYPQLTTYNVSPATDALIGRYVGSGGVMPNMLISVACAWNRKLNNAEWEALNNWAYRTWGAGTQPARSAVSGRSQVSNRTLIS